MTLTSVFQVKVTNILSAIDAAEYLIAHNASHVVKQVGDRSIIGIHIANRREFLKMF